MSRLKLLTIALALFAAGCSSGGGEMRRASEDLTDAPDVSPTAAPRRRIPIFLFI